MRKINDLDRLDTAHSYNILINSREIFLHGNDIEDSGVDHRMAMNFIKNLRILENSNEIITIHQYSIGGDWSSGMAIYDAIKNSTCSFIFICHGVAASMGSIIPQAVLNKGYRVTQKNCDWLLHEGNLYLEGIPTQTKSNLEYYEANKKTMYDIYTDSCMGADFFSDKNRSQIKAFIKNRITMKTDWCLNSEEVVKYGLVDGILGEEGYENLETIKSYL